jgi:serine/threonine protein kinase
MQSTRSILAAATQAGASRRLQLAGAAAGGPANERILDGRYRLLARLGAGGFGVVYRAYDEELAREVAVKRIELPRLSAHAGGASALARARQEALAAARLCHPAIAALYEARVEGATLYLISELVEGESLRAHNARRSLHRRALIAIGIALCEALEHAHERGVIHCDVTPANVLVTPAALLGAHERGVQPVAKLTDFGSALIERGSGRAPFANDPAAQPREIVGTLAYMAPEQRAGDTCGPPADLYAAALVIYESLSGVNPQRGRGGGEQEAANRAPDLRGTSTELPAVLVGALPGTGEVRQESARSGEPAARAQPWRHAEERVSPTRIFARAGRARVEAQRAIAPGAISAGQAALPPPPTPLPPPARAHDASASVAGVRGRARGIARRWWWAIALSAIALEAIFGAPALAILCLAGALPLLALPRASSLAPALALLSPALGAIGLAGAFPALAGQARRWRTRAGIALLGGWWTIALQPIAPALLWVWPPRPRHPPHLHAGAPPAKAAHALAALLVPATAEVLALWIAAAILLPSLVRGRSALRDLVAAILWSATLTGATGAILRGSAPRGALLGAVIGALIAIAGRAMCDVA